MNVFAAMLKFIHKAPLMFNIAITRCDNSLLSYHHIRLLLFIIMSDYYYSY